jgi:TRAP-type mannitol/chloroaromatic compound transport system permease small subunit
MMTHQGWRLLVRAIERKEVSELSYWWPPLWPVRLTVALGITFLLIAAISWIIKCIYELRTGKELKSGLEVE